MLEDDVFKFISKFIRKFDENIKDEEITKNALLIDDLGLDSLDVQELAISLQKKYNIEIKENEASQNMSVLVELVTKKINEKKS
jgi:acyl carrier protein